MPCRRLCKGLLGVLERESKVSSWRFFEHHDDFFLIGAERKGAFLWWVERCPVREVLGLYENTGERAGMVGSWVA